MTWTSVLCSWALLAAASLGGPGLAPAPQDPCANKCTIISCKKGNDGTCRIVCRDKNGNVRTCVVKCSTRKNCCGK